KEDGLALRAVDGLDVEVLTHRLARRAARRTGQRAGGAGADDGLVALRRERAGAVDLRLVAEREQGCVVLDGLRVVDRRGRRGLRLIAGRVRVDVQDARVGQVRRLALRRLALVGHLR